MRVVVMGVSGCGKSTLGQGLATHLSLPFLEGDSLHPPRNVALMAAGTPLTDADRWGWLEAIGQRLAAADAPRGLVVSCSALKRSYRDLLRSAAPGVQFIHLHGAPSLLQSRMHQRIGHYMPPALLTSQLATLEMPASDEKILQIDIAATAAQQLNQALSRLVCNAPDQPDAT
jgi:carbohydrate kinase (thermoresistant glucokinase family)